MSAGRKTTLRGHAIEFQGGSAFPRQLRARLWRLIRIGVVALAICLTAIRGVRAQELAPGHPRETEEVAKGPLKTPRSATVLWDRGFLMRTSDEAFELRLRGIVQADAVFYPDPGDNTDHTNFFLRRARLYIEGRSFQFFEYRWMVDFGRGKQTIRDAYGDIHIIDDKLEIRAGKFKQPFSYEQYVMEDRTLPVFERSLVDQLTPARNIGFMVHGRVKQVLAWATSVTNGTRDGDNDEPFRDAKDVYARVGAFPLDTPHLKGPRRLVVGFSGGYGRETFKWDPGLLQTPLRVVWFKFNKDVQNAGARIRLMPELYYFRGPFGAGAQYLHQTQVVRAPDHPALTVHFDGYFAMASLLLTGENRSTYAEFIDPDRPFDPRDPIHHPGAWEILARISGLYVSHDAFDARYALVNPSLWSPSATEISANLNWYMNRFAWFVVDYEHSVFGSPLPLGKSKAFRGSNAVGVRATVMW